MDSVLGVVRRRLWRIPQEEGVTELNTASSPSLVRLRDRPN